MALPAGFSGDGVAHGSKLFDYLSRQIPERPMADFLHFDSKPLDPLGSIFLLTERETGHHLVCKFFERRQGLTENECRNLLDHEFRSLIILRLNGFDHAPFAVVKPLAKIEELGFLLAEEFVPGQSMDYFIAKAAYDGQGEHLCVKLRALAEFFARLHSSTRIEKEENFSRVTVFFRNMIDALVQLKVAQPISADRLRHRCDKWEARHEMWSDHQSFVHGDATPTNFIFGPDEETLTAIDFERLHVSDAMYDIGLFAAELKHHFALRIHNAAAAEPFIKCFLEHYFQATDKQEESYSDFTFRNRFYMALGELRIARNPWLPFGHREWLIHEAGRCLET